MINKFVNITLKCSMDIEYAKHWHDFHKVNLIVIINDDG